MDTVLAGDIGGTNTRLALYDPASLREPRFIRVFRSGDYESLLAIINVFLTDCAEGGQDAPVRAGFGVAGPVSGPEGGQIVKLTNLPWVIDGERIRERLGLERVCFVNDFAANCLAVTRMEKEDLHPIGVGTPLPGEPIAVLGAGTGLGEGFLIPRGRSLDDYTVVPSEGGHADFAPRNPLEIRLLEYLTEKFSRASYERILSGNGLINVYEFFRDREGLTESSAVRDQMRQGDPAAVITQNGLDRSDVLCDRAMDVFCAVYGAEAGNLALKVLAKGGVYLAGGIAGKILPRLEEGGFRHGFENKGRYTTFLESIPTYVITHPQPGLMGAAIAAQKS